MSAQPRMVEAIGIVSLGIQVCQGLLKYYDSWKDSRKDIAALCSSVESLSSILDQLEQTLTGTHETKSTISDCIEACRSSMPVRRASTLDHPQRELPNSLFGYVCDLVCERLYSVLSSQFIISQIT